MHMSQEAECLYMEILQSQQGSYKRKIWAISIHFYFTLHSLQGLSGGEFTFHKPAWLRRLWVERQFMIPLL